jgi:hypothetical protein
VGPEDVCVHVYTPSSVSAEVIEGTEGVGTLGAYDDSMMRGRVCRGHPREGDGGVEGGGMDADARDYTGYTEHEIPSGAPEAILGSVPSLSCFHPLCPIASLSMLAFASSPFCYRF